MIAAALAELRRLTRRQWLAFAVLSPTGGALLYAFLLIGPGR